MMNRLATFIAILTLSGCSSLYTTLLPLNISLGYVSAISIHEGAHSGVAAINGADEIDVTLFPFMRDGHLYGGMTEVEHGGWSREKERAFNLAGPMANLLTYVGIRELLKTGAISRGWQPTVAWISAANQLVWYYQATLGLIRNDSGDLGKEDEWISAALLGLSLSYDIWNLLDEKGKFFSVLFGRDFYGNEPGGRISFGAGWIRLDW